jgi:hypothetical protein
MVITVEATALTCSEEATDWARPNDVSALLAILSVDEIATVADVDADVASLLFSDVIVEVDNVALPTSLSFSEMTLEDDKSALADTDIALVIDEVSVLTTVLLSVDAPVDVDIDIARWLLFAFDVNSDEAEIVLLSACDISNTDDDVRESALETELTAFESATDAAVADDVTFESSLLVIPDDKYSVMALYPCI